LVARTRVIQPRQGMGKRPFGIMSTGDLSITRAILFNVRICIASQQAEGYEAGQDVCSVLASHDACASLLIDLLTGGLMNVLAFLANI
jgi:hypothetical protein